MKATNSRGVSGASSVYSHQVQSAHAGARLYFKANVELRHDFEARGRRAGGARAPITPAAGPAPLHAAGSLHRRARKAAAVNAAPAAKAAHAGALCVHTHTHSLTLPAKAERAGDVPSRRAHFHCARNCAHLLSIHSVWGGAGLQVVNVASSRTRIQIWRRFRKAQVLHAYVMHWQMHIYETILHICCISDILFIVSIYHDIAYCLSVTYNRTYGILHTVHIFHVVHTLHIMYIMHVVHIYA